jgi:O-antigen/teichoic acid export membrane protein
LGRVADAAPAHESGGADIAAVAPVAPGASSVAKTVVASLVIQLVNVGTGVLLARALGPVGRGELAAVMIWPTVLSIFASVGLTEATTYHAARRTRSPGALAATSLVLASGGSAIACVLGFVLLPIVLGAQREHVVHVSQLFLMQVPLSLGALYLMAILNGHQRYAAFNALRVLQVASAALLLAALSLNHDLNIQTAILAYLASSAVTLLVAYACVSRKLDGPLRYSAHTARVLLSFGVRSYAGTVPTVLNQRLDQLVISALLPPRELGLYVVAITFTAVTSIVGTSLAYAVLPAMAASDVGDREQLLRQYIGTGLLLAIASALPVFIAAQLLLGFFFGSGYEDAVAVTRVLLIGTVFWTGARIVEAGLRGLHRPFEASVGELMALGATVLLLPVLLPTAGIMGAAVVSLVAYATSFGWLIRRAALRLDTTPRALLRFDHSVITRMAHLLRSTLRKR